MSSRSLAHLGDAAVLAALTKLVSQERATLASVLLHIAEVEARGLYRAQACTSMFHYCVRRLGMSEDMAYKRIQAARAVRDFSPVFDAVVAGRVHLTGVVLLAPKLTFENVDELIAVASHKTKAEIELLIAERFPKRDVVTLVRALPTKPLEQLTAQVVATSGEELVPEPVGTGTPPSVQTLTMVVEPTRVESPRRPKLVPIAPRRFALQVTLDQGTHDKLRHAQRLLSHAVPASDVAQLLDRAFDALIEKVEKRKLGASSKPRTARAQSGNPRHVPAEIKRKVWKRDGGQCTFVSDDGHRCEAVSLLEFDHVTEVARGGRGTLENIRLRCRAHNRFTAEQTFGAGFIATKIERARRVNEPLGPD